jgi:hypothetical protein
MDAEQLDALARRHGVFATTAMYMHNPRDDFDRWSRGWAEINRLVDEINRMVEPREHPPA